MAVFNTINTTVKPTDTTAVDITQPYTFLEWKTRNSNISTGDAFSFYNSYLKTWYVARDTVNVVATNFVKDYYKVFLKTLGVTARTQDEKDLFENVNIDDNFSLQSTIVGYARRLKDVAVYLANKRNDIVYSKLKNNLTGTAPSLERLFYTYILTAFTRKISPDGLINNSFVITNPDILTSLPYLSVISNDFSIQTEEIYDTSNYFDRDPSKNYTVNGITSTVNNTEDILRNNSGNYGIPEGYLIASVIAGVATTNTTSMASTLPAYFTFTGDNSTTSFVLADITSSTASDYQVSIEGVMQTPDNSYTISTQNQSITFTEAPPVNSIIVVVKRY